MVAIGKGTLHRDVSVASFVCAEWTGITLYEKSMVDLVSRLFSAPLNNQDEIEYLPSQAIAEYIRDAGFDGIEYRSAQFRNGINLALFNVGDWSADSANTFEVEDIIYKAVRNKALVEIFGYPEEQL